MFDDAASGRHARHAMTAAVPRQRRGRLRGWRGLPARGTLFPSTGRAEDVTRPARGVPDDCTCRGVCRAARARRADASTRRPTDDAVQRNRGVPGSLAPRSRMHWRPRNRTSGHGPGPDLGRIPAGRHHADRPGQPRRRLGPDGAPDPAGVDRDRHPRRPGGGGQPGRRRRHHRPGRSGHPLRRRPAQPDGVRAGDARLHPHQREPGLHRPDGAARAPAERVRGGHRARRLPLPHDRESCSRTSGATPRR